MTTAVTRQMTERRTSRRQPTIGTVCRIQSPAVMDGAEGLVWNISRGGVSMLFNQPLERGSTVTGLLATSTDGFAMSVTMHVRHVIHLSNGDYLIGNQFDRPILAEQMEHFIPVV
jgi:hypothetical protein